MIIVAVDPGKARTGLAVCDKTMFLASPLCVIEEWNRKRLAEKVAAAAAKENAELIIIGLPKNMDGSEGESALAARDFALLMANYTDIPIKMLDERCTTMIAHRYLNDNNVRGKKRKKTVDAVAATVILQSYLDSLKK
ncbi:MAG: Holliday junction resolvase RuvX [Clostridia bacterium]|nr:Holliday junction resolvase RuvX [Clostridia bacterium]